MDKEVSKYCIKIMADHLSGKETRISISTDCWEQVIACCQRHELIGFLYYQCKNIVPDSYKAFLESQISAIMYFYANRAKLESDVLALFAENEIDGIIIKGSTVAQFYPVPSLRTMGDTDIVVYSEDIEKVHELLLQAEFQPHSHDYEQEWKYYYENMEFEIHDRLVYSEASNGEGHAEFFNNFWKYVKNGKLDWNFHFLFLIFHLRKHFLNRGVGFRQFIDIAVLIRENKELNWLWIENKIKELGMWEFSQRVFALIEYWFGILPPLTIRKFNEEFLEEATRQIFDNGLFGFANEKNDRNNLINYVRNADRKRFGLRRFFSFLFPSYNTMRQVSSCSFVDGRPYMLPFAWIYRFIKSMKAGKSGKAFQVASKVSFVSKEAVRERTKTLEKWGL